MKAFEGIYMQLFGWVSYAIINVVQKITPEITTEERLAIVGLKKLEQDLINAQLMTFLLLGLIITSILTIVKFINGYIKKEENIDHKLPLGPKDLLG